MKKRTATFLLSTFFFELNAICVMRMPDILAMLNHAYPPRVMGLIAPLLSSLTLPVVFVAYLLEVAEIMLLGALVDSVRRGRPILQGRG